ncbi:non-ribosomal peptide synthetase [Pseudoalteromonas sp. MMG012]|uniref:non-ribosomal peptide synthetase n=1 Tax=Pseudoalteromonas sp. MMG012 TaxID=2822686 RepID=UPI001B3A0A27|nr:non-ribosomal peptide synthetase [Pseudoalteromonas sp. MMG012]MBQ4849263.1 amino acid adenylation domain-containing protein [Pseudoalteromonas sp. MMG012]
MLNLCQLLAKDNVAVWANGDKVQIAHSDAGVSPQWIEWLTENKSTLLQFLNDKRIFNESDFEQALDNELASDSEIKGIYPANSMQKGFIYHHLVQPDDDAYRVQLIIDYNQSLDLDLYKEAWILASMRYPALRVSFDWENDILQVIKGGAGFTDGHFSFLDWSNQTVQQQQQQLEDIIKSDRHTPFDLSQSGLMRFKIIKRGAQHFTLLKTEHHSISDGWSFPVLLQTVHKNYQLLSQQKPAVVIEETAYEATQRHYAQQTLTDNTYWKTQKQQFEHANDLNRMLSTHIDLSKSVALTNAGSCELKLPSDLHSALKKLAQQQGLTLNVLMQFAWHKIIQLYCQDTQTIVGTTVSGRELPIDEIHSSVGLYINTLPLALNWSQSKSISDLLTELKHAIAQMNSHTGVALSELQDPGSRLFHSLFVFENYPTPTGTDVLAWSFNKMIEKVDYPLTISVVEQQDVLLLKLSFCHSWLTQVKANRILQQMEKVLVATTQDLNQSHNDIVFLDEAESQRLLIDHNNTPSVNLKTTVHHLVWQNAQRYPDDIALQDDSNTLTYAQLDQRADTLASHIQAEQARSDNPSRFIGIFATRSIDMVVSMLAILKAGYAYAPLNPEYPDQRISYILDDTQCTLVLTQSDLQLRFERLNKAFSCNTVPIDKVQLFEQSRCQIATTSSADDAYIIYTSGTTGEPKGVVVPHRAIVSLVESTDVINATRDDVYLHMSNPNFDAATFEVWAPLVQGAKLVVAPAHCGAEPDQIATLLQKNAISILWLTRTLFDSLYVQKNNIYDGLKCVISGGETLTPHIVKDIIARDNRPTRLINAYGPTESTTFATFYNCADFTGSVPIGQPINQRKVYLLDDNLTPVPTGVAGELYISGAGLAKGYLNKPELTAERFIDNPFASASDIENGYDKLYKTGDLVRWTFRGELEYIGRNDHQIKLRGFRIELPEIETVLTDQTEIKQGVVTVFEQAGNKQLLAYFIRNEKEAFCEVQLREKLALALPDYMIPTYFMEVEHLPMNNNGKIDFKSLPQPSITASDNYVEATSELEQQLCQIWQQVLGIEKIGVRDDFFRIGGDSIVSIQLVSALRQAGHVLQVKDIIEAPTIAEQAYLLQTQQSHEVTIMTEQGLLEGEFELLPIQNWFFDNLPPNPNHWNQAFTLNVSTTYTHQHIQQALAQLNQQHDMLRCTFETNSNNTVQRYQADHMAPTLIHINASDLSTGDEGIHATLTELQSQFDLHQGPLWCAALITHESSKHNRLFLAFHHSIIDVVSWRVISEDLQTLLKNETLADKGTSYRQWVNAVQDYATHNQAQLKYWQQVQSDFSPLESSSDAQQYTIQLAKSDTDKLLREANTGLNTEINDLLLSSLAIALKATFGESTNHIQLEGHGRELIDPQLDVSRTVGWFTTTYPVRLDVAENTIDTIVHTKENLRQIPDKGIGFGSFCLTQQMQAITPQVCFNYLGQLNNNSTEGEWHLSDQNVGYVMTQENAQANSPLLLNINGAVRNGQLDFSVVSKLDQNHTLAFLEHFKSALHQVIDTACKQAQICTLNTPADYGVKDLSWQHLQSLQAKYDIQTIYPANSLQQGFIYHSVNYPNDDAYRVQLVMDIKQTLNVELFIKAWHYTSQQFPILRTAFDWQETLLQIVTKQPSIDHNNFEVIDLSHLDRNCIEREITQLQQQDRQIGFNLQQPGLIRFKLIKQQANHFTLIKTEHHSINDGWSGPMLLQAVSQHYRQLLDGNTPNVTEQLTYLNAQAYYLKHADRSQSFWQQEKQRFGNANAINALLDNTIDFNINRTLEQVECVELQLQGEPLQQLQSVCQQQGVTLNAALQFAWHKLIAIYSADEQTIVGTTVSGREIPVQGIEQAVGLFINTLPLAIDWPADASCRDILKQIQKRVASLNSHSDVSLSRLQNNGERLFHSLFVFENYPAPETTGAWHFRESIEKGDYPLSVVAQQEGDSLSFKMHFNPNWLTTVRANDLLNELSLILSKLCANPEQPHSQLATQTLKQQSLLQSWNNTERAFDATFDLATLFEQHAQATPNAIAIATADGETLSYQALNHRADTLAAYIVESHPDADTCLPADCPIALYFERSVNMLVAILATLKAGGAYVPVSPQYPHSRVEFILEDTQTALVLTDTTLCDTLAPMLDQAQCINVDLCTDPLVDITLTRPNNLERLAYIIYTSGTTGTPKGVMLSQRNALYYLDALTHALGKQYQRIDFSSNYCFDLSVTTTLCPLLHGQQICLYTGDILDVDAYRDHIRTLNVQFVKTTPSLALSIFPDSDTQVATLMLGGEALTEQNVQTLAPYCDAIFDEYGPTEATVGAMLAQAYPRQHQGIGKPYSNVQLHVLSDALLPVPIGAPGELYISGCGVAKGYLNRDELNQERFIDNPFSHQPNHTRLYKTGDLARWLNNGDIQYLGRNDEQVKIRGYRVELGEISAVLSALPELKNAVVIDVAHNAGQALAAYLVPHNADEVDIAQLRVSLSQQLPEYMVPSSFTIIEDLPLTGNGKLNRAALPTPTFTDENNYVAPRNELEQQLCDIWQEVLGIEQVGIEDNFFRLGGDSIIAIRLMNQCNKTLSLSIPITVLFEHKTVAAIADNCHTQAQGPDIDVPNNSDIEEQTNSIRI